MKARKRVLSVGSIFLRVMIAALFLTPFYTAFVYSFKNRNEIAMTGLQFPQTLRFDNFRQAIENTNTAGMPFFKVIGNTLIVTIVGTLVLTFLSAMAAYVLARRKGRLYTVIYSVLVMTLLIPIQAYMFPLYDLLRSMNLLNTLNGFLLAKIASQLGYSIIITTGFVKGIPQDIEEAAQVDGCNVFYSFFRVVLPLMRPIILTGVVINALNIWNDFSLAFIVLSRPQNYIVSLLQFTFIGTNSVEIHLAFALFSMSMLPILILYFILQRYIISGIAMGAVKG